MGERKEQRPSPFVAGRIAHDEEGGVSYVQRLVALCGPSGMGQGEPWSSASPSTIYISSQYPTQERCRLEAANHSSLL